jgi:hypothetical protein
MKTIPEIFRAAQAAGFTLTANLDALAKSGVTTPSQICPENIHRSMNFGSVSVAALCTALGHEVVTLSEQVDKLTAERDALKAQLDKVRAAFS